MTGFIPLALESFDANFFHFLIFDSGVKLEAIGRNRRETVD
jgi:hypothetical protein